VGIGTWVGRVTSAVAWLEHFQLLRSAGFPVPHCGIQATFSRLFREDETRDKNVRKTADKNVCATSKLEPPMAGQAVRAAIVAGRAAGRGLPAPPGFVPVVIEL